MKSSITLALGFMNRHLSISTNLVVATYFVQNAIRLVSTIVLTRLLAPDAYAIMGIVGSFAFVTTMLTDVGFQAFMLRHERFNERAFRDAVWTFRFVRSCFLAILFFSLAAPLAIWIQKPEAIFALQIFSLTFIIDGLVPISNITALADGRLKKYCLADVILSIFTLLVGVTVAWFFPGIYSLVYAGLISSTIRVFLFRLLLPDSFLVWRIDGAIIKGLLNFGKYIVASSVITLLLMQVDKIGLSRILDVDRLGVYFLAANLAMVPRGLASAISSKSLYPAYARTAVHGIQVAKHEFYKSRALIDWVIPLGCLVGCLIAPLLVSILYDSRYAKAGLFLAILLFGLIPLIWNLAINEFLVANGWTSTTFKGNVVRLAWVSVTAIPFLFDGRLFLFLIAMALTEFCAYFYLLISIYNLGICRVKHEIFCISFALCSAIIFGAFHIRGSLFEVF